MKYYLKYIVFFFISFLLLNTSTFAQKRKKKTKNTVVKKKSTKKTITKTNKTTTKIPLKNNIQNGVNALPSINTNDTLPEKMVTIFSEFKPQLKNVAKINFDVASIRKDTINLHVEYQVPSQNLSFQYRPIALVPRSFKSDTTLYTQTNTLLKFGYGNFKHHFIELSHNFTDYNNNTQVFTIENESITGNHHLQQTKDLGFTYTGNFNVSNQNHIITNVYLKNVEKYRYGLVSDSSLLPNSDFKQHTFLGGISLGLINGDAINESFNYKPIFNYETFSSVANSTNNYIQLKSPFSVNFKNQTQFLLDFDFSLNLYKNSLSQSSTNQLLKIEPAFKFNKFGSDFNVGVSPVLINNTFNLFPKIEFTKTLNDTNIVVNMGWHAKFINNKFSDLNAQNPWLFAPDKLEITTQDAKFIKVQFANTKRLNYGFSFSLNDFTNLPLFNTLINNNVSKNGLFYNAIFEKKASTIQLDANMSYQFSDKVFFDNVLGYTQFNALSTNSKPWGILPFTLNSKITWMPNRKFQINGNLQYWTGAAITNKLMQVENMERVIMLNASMSYHINKHLSFWAKGDNLLDKSYQRWLYYPPIGLQIMGGVVYLMK